MNEENKLKLEIEKEYLKIIEFAMDQLITKSMNPRYEKNLKKLQKDFDVLKSNLNYNKYKKRTNSNIKDLKGIGADTNEIRIVLGQKFDNYDLIDRVMGKIEYGVLKDKISKLSSEYMVTLNNIKMYKSLIEKANSIKNENEEIKADQSSKKISFEEEQEQRKNKEKMQYEEQLDKVSTSLLSGPKKVGIADIFNKKDLIKNDIAYLYGLAADILVLMEQDQFVRAKSRKEDEEYRISNISFPYCEEYKKEQILSKYGVTTVDMLLDVYESIRDQYYKKYSKLKETEKSKYEYSNYNPHEIICSFGSGRNIDFSISQTFKTSNYKFPPSKQDLINSINFRIINGENYEMVQPKQDEYLVGEPKNYDEYLEVKKYYENLTKNMSVEECALLYHQVQKYITNSVNYEVLKNYNGVIQKMFSEIIFYKKGLKYSDQKQMDMALLNIVKEDLKEDVIFSMNATDKLSETETKEREKTIEQEYIKYRATSNLEGNQKPLSFKEFARKKYELQDMHSSENQQIMQEEDIKGMKR